MSDNSLDPLVYGGGQVLPVMAETGVDNFYAARDVIMANEYELVMLKPGELGPDQPNTAVVMTFKGRDDGEKGSKAVTVVFTTEMARHIIANLRSQYVKIPIENR